MGDCKKKNIFLISLQLSNFALIISLEKSNATGKLSISNNKKI